MIEATSEYLMQKPRSLRQAEVAREAWGTFREFRDFAYRNATKAVTDVRLAARDLPDGGGKDTILAMCSDIEDEFQARLMTLEEEARNT